MIPSNQKNRKSQVNLACPTCGLDLTARATHGFTRDGETFCCQGCADGTGCICEESVLKPAPRSRKRGAVEQREPGAFARAPVNGPEKPATSKRKSAIPARYPSRTPRVTDPPKRKRSRTKPRDSTREQARGRSEFPGALNRGAASQL